MKSKHEQEKQAGTTLAAVLEQALWLENLSVLGVDCLEKDSSGWMS